eukprot:14326753-Alexandrium_andersonii.AAC.1
MSFDPNKCCELLEHGLCAASPSPSIPSAELLPGKSYYAMVRAISAKVSRLLRPMHPLLVGIER